MNELTLLRKKSEKFAAIPFLRPKEFWTLRKAHMYRPSADFLKRMRSLVLGNQVPGLGLTYEDAIIQLQLHDVHMLIHGGAVRDTLLGKPSKDVDLIFDKPVDILKTYGKHAGWHVMSFDAQKEYIAFGCSKVGECEPLEGCRFTYAYFKQGHDMEFSVNSLSYSYQHNVLIDITGRGLHDLFSYHIRIPCEIDCLHMWYQEAPKKLLRYFKLVAKGFKPCNYATESYVVHTLKAQWSEDFMSDVYTLGDTKITLARHFFVKNIASGWFDDTGCLESVSDAGRVKLEKLVDCMREVFKRNGEEHFFMTVIAREANLSL